MKQIYLSKGQVAIVDDEDFEVLNCFRWSATCSCGRFYAVRKKVYPDGSRRNLYMHRVITGALKSHVDHIDGNGLNNQRSNLRLCTSAQNSWNRRKLKGSKSGAKGVSWDTRGRKWKAQITVSGQRIHLGMFTTVAAAARAYSEAASFNYGRFMHGAEDE